MQEFVRQDTESPEINFVTIKIVCADFRREVIHRSAVGATSVIEKRKEMFVCLMSASNLRMSWIVIQMKRFDRIGF